MIDIRLGRWQDVLADVEADVLVADRPYSRRQIAGYRSGSDAQRCRAYQPRESGEYVIPYAAWSPDDAAELVEWAVEHVRWWCVLFGDHVVWGWLEELFAIERWHTFAPVVWTKPNPAPRMAGDGPCCAAEHILIARPKRRLPMERRGHRRGWYEHAVDPSGGAARSRGTRLVGQKPVGLMSAIVADYTLRGDIVVDPFAGTGTTLVAAHRMGRRAVGAEVDEGRYQAALERCRLEQSQVELQGVIG